MKISDPEFEARLKEWLKPFLEKKPKSVNMSEAMGWRTAKYQEFVKEMKEKGSLEE